MDSGGRDNNVEPSAWQLAEALIANIRDVTRRAEGDSLLFIATAVGFLVVRSSGVSSLSAIGLQITNIGIIQFALTPIGAFLALRFAKAEALTTSLSSELRSLLVEHLPHIPKAVAPPDWDVVRDICVRARRVGTFIPVGFSMVMLGIAVAGSIVNTFDAGSADIAWVITSNAAVALLIGLWVLTRPVWPNAVVVRSPQD